MKQLKEKEYEEFQQYLYNKAHGYIWTPDTLELICGERGQVLDRNVLLTAKAAAHEHGLDDHALGLVVPAKHVGTLFARVVGTLVGRLHLDAVLVREGNGALGLQEGMLGKGRGKALRYGKRALCQRLGGVAARHVTALAHVVAVKMESLIRMASHRIHHSRPSG